MSGFLRRFAAPRAAGSGALLLAAACGGGGDGGGGGTGVPAPSVPTPAPVAAVVSFGAASAEVFEGGAAAIPIRYESRSLAAPWRLRISPFPGTASAADFSLPESAVEIPAGSGTSGEVSFTVAGLFDDDFEEGTETLRLAFVPDPAVEAQLGADLTVSIREGGALLSFGPGPVEVTEGAAGAAAIRYEVRHLPAALPLSVSALPGTAAASEFRLERTAFEVPAGRGVSGELAVPLSAPADRFFSEGDETATIRFVPPGAAAGIRLGADLEFTIREGGASPCPGLTLSARPPTASEPGEDRLGAGHLFTRLTLLREPAAAGTTLDFRGPYYWEERLAEFDYQPFAATRIARWSAERAGTAIRHELDIEWPDAATLLEPDLELGFLGGSCSGQPVASCSAEGCELTP